MADRLDNEKTTAASAKLEAQVARSEEHEKLSELFAKSGIPLKYVVVVYQFVRQHAAWRASRTESIEAWRDSLRYRWVRTSALVKCAGNELDSMVDAGMKADEMTAAEDETKAGA